MVAFVTDQGGNGASSDRTGVFNFIVIMIP
jgi:hypothetical protein